MLILNAAEVRAALRMPDAIAAMKTAFAALSSGQAVVPPRAHLPIEAHAGISLIMPSYIHAPEMEALAVKVVSLFDGNRLRGLARIQATVLVLDPETGQIQALLEGSTLTAIRTAAASGAATDLLARPDSRVVALFGAGVQARDHARAMCAVRRITEIRVHSRTPAAAEAMIVELAAELPVRFVLCATPAEALDGSDIVCCTTTAVDPIFEDRDLPAGVHMNAVGSFKPHVRDVPEATVVRASVFVDSRETAWEEAGDLIQPLEAGRIRKEHILAELGELVLGKHPGRRLAEEVTLFKSVGVAVQDASAARMVMTNAGRMALGTKVTI
jgi:ornithine cyclodeaminase